MNKKSKDSSKAKKNSLPHDALIKKVIENPIAAKEFLEEYLPESFKNVVNLETIKVEKESFVEKHLTKQLSDIVLSATTKDNQQAFIYTLIEAQVTPDYWIAFRLWKYTLPLLERHMKNKEKLPLICTLVLYHGSKKYTSPRNLWELFGDQGLAREILSSNYPLVDLQAMNDDEINYSKHLSIILYLMKHIHQRDTLKLIADVLKHCREAIIIDSQQDYLYTRFMIWYTNSRVPVDQKKELEQIVINNLPSKDVNKVMKTIADSYKEEWFDKGLVQGIEQGREEGIEEGIQAGIEKAAINMLKSNLELKFISSVTGLSIDILQKLKASL